ncbi:non-muscle caldesmon isoform X2 [Perca flavescens]|uniref:non-muscle caldesmon isoform X2 n=1 Tax=Perca flavescens TaxID=8167 RepID=UPI00106DDA96|nr:non-muscle caldesmon-like isoform X2 [Perca flavescens]
MSNALLRRSSTKQGLQNLIRLTAQRSVEDAEEVEREQRRRAREASRWTNGGSLPAQSSLENETPAEESMYNGALKPSGSPSLEEDEGFSDWTQRRERQRQQRLQELGHGGEEDDDEEENAINKAVPAKSVQASVASSSRLQRQRHEDEEDGAAVEMERKKQREEEEMEDERKRKEVMTRREEIQRPNTEMEKRKDVKISYTSKVFLHQESKLGNGDSTKEEVTSYKSKTTKRPTSRAAEPEESQAILETERRLEKIRLGLQQKESQELEQLRHRQAEAEQELEQLKKRREERRRVREEEERRREEEEQQRLAREEEERRRMKEDIERRRTEAAERMKSLSTSSADGDEAFSPFCPKAPTHKITERTESLNRSLKKSNSFKKTATLVLLPKIDDKLEQYAHAVENSQEARAVKATLTDLPSSPEVVSSKKTLFEAGEAWSQAPAKLACKDAEGLKVVVAERITRWVKGPSDGSRPALCKPTDVRPGDVMQKKNMWEVIGDSIGQPGTHRVKGSAAGKKYKFVVTGHGKYEKIPVDDENEGEFINAESDLYPDRY